MATGMEDSLTLRPKEPWPALDRWKSAPALNVATIPDDGNLHETLRRFSAPAVVDEQQAQDTDKHIRYENCLEGCGRQADGHVALP
jgi:hypothetical protein